MNFGFVIDNRKCIGCHACTLACKAEHEVPIGVNRTWVKYVEKGEYPNTQRLFSVLRCNHCSDAPCVTICPTTALHTRDDGIVDFDNQRCIGCKGCMQACPYDALYIDPETFTAAKCNYCAHRIDIGLEPACVNVCPTHAIISGDMENADSEISLLLSRQKVQVRKPEKGTLPKLFYINGDELSLVPTEAEKQQNYLWSQQTSGVGHYTGDTQETAFSPVPKDPLHSSKEEEVNSSLQKKARRVYDAPDKGVLWKWEVSAYVLTKAIASGVFLLAFGLQWIQPISSELIWFTGGSALFFLMVTSLLLIKDLDQPKRFLYVVLRPQWKSWLVRGAYILMGYGLFLTLWLGAHFFQQPLAFSMFSWLGALFAFGASVYTAFLFAQAKGRDFWQSPLLAFHMLNHSLLGGCAFFLIFSPFWEPLSRCVPWLVRGLMVGIFLALLFVFFELNTAHATQDTQKTIQKITRGSFKWHFWGGMILFGLVAPFGLLLLNSSPIMAAIASILVFTGLWCALQIWVLAPQQIPLS